MGNRKNFYTGKRRRKGTQKKKKGRKNLHANVEGNTYNTQRKQQGAAASRSKKINGQLNGHACATTTTAALQTRIKKAGHADNNIHSLPSQHFLTRGGAAAEAAAAGCRGAKPIAAAVDPAPSSASQPSSSSHLANRSSTIRGRGTVSFVNRHSKGLEWKSDVLCASVIAHRAPVS